MTWDSLPAVLREHAERNPDGRALRTRWVDSWSPWLSWSELFLRLEAVARGLAAEGVRAGERVVLALPEPRDSLLVILALWRLNAVPVQVGVAGGEAASEPALQGLRDLIAGMGARTLIVSEGTVVDRERFAGVRVLVTPLHELGGASGAQLEPVERVRGAAFIQLTSGTTARPKGVVVHHDALVRHVQGFCEVFPVHSESAGLVWLPMYHDMGLVGGFAFNLYAGGPCSFMSPSDFRRNAFGWIEAIAESRATMTSGPPAAFRLCARFGKRAVAKKLDLSAWEVAVVGAEPIPPDVLREFTQAYAPCGFRLETFYPAYGMAEATLCAAIHTPHTPRRVDRVDRQALEREQRAIPAVGDAQATELVSLGPAFPGTDLEVVGADGEPLPERSVGEIRLRSRSMMAGYFGSSEQESSAAASDWWMTGDLGYQAEGHLYVTGRKKELIIVAGRNLIPSILEEAVGAVAGVRAGRVAALGIPSRHKATERLCIVAETRWLPEEHPVLAAAVQAALAASGVVADQLVFVAPGSLPQTTSGKLQRAAVKRALLAGELRAPQGLGASALESV